MVKTCGMSNRIDPNRRSRENNFYKHDIKYDSRQPPLTTIIVQKTYKVSEVSNDVMKIILMILFLTVATLFGFNYSLNGVNGSDSMVSVGAMEVHGIHLTLKM